MFSTVLALPMKSPYEILGVPKTASASQIKRAYRKLAKRFHPDALGKVGDADKFREATEAYELLCEPQRRKLYDETGIAATTQKSGPDAKIVELIVGFAMQAMQQNPMGCNPIEKSRQIISARIAACEQTIRGDADIAKRFRHVAWNVMHEGDGENVIAAALNIHADGADNHAKGLLNEIEGLKKALNMLEEYWWLADGQNQRCMLPKMERVIREEITG